MEPAVTPEEDLSPLDLLRAELEQQIKDGTLQLPLLPNVAQEVLQLCSDDDTDASDLSDLIHRDQALASHMLRIANSPAYMARTEITSLQQAVARLGTAAISEIALAISLRGEIFDVPGYQKDITYIWRHSLGSALWGKTIGRELDKEAETAFLCGLLHHIGKPIVLHSMIKLSRAKEMEIKVADMRAMIDFHHTGVGILVADAWRLPAPVGAAIAHYYSYEDCEKYADLAMLTHCADLLATHLLDPGVMPEERVRASPVITDLNISDDQLDELFARREEINEWVESMVI